MDELLPCFHDAKAAQSAMAAMPVRERLRILKSFRHLLAEHAKDFVETCAPQPEAEVLTAQVLPLAAACRFLEKRAVSLLATRRLGKRDRPLWLAGVDTEIRREPHGIILIIAPSNYPLLLPGVQVLQALAAGNAVLLKPGAGGAKCAHLLAGMLAQAGLDRRLIGVLPESRDAGRAALKLPVDKVIFTGSSAAGREVLTELGKRGIPCTAELSGCDAVFVREDADIELTVKALRFGLRFNGGATCIAPRRVFVSKALAASLDTALKEENPPLKTASERTVSLVREALARGAEIVSGDFDAMENLRLPCVLRNATPDMEIMRSDCFEPVFCLTAVESDEEALELAARCPFALGASIFSKDETAARKLAGRVRAGNVTVNDLIVPTADPRVPFGGRGASGYGVTRGAEGLLEMTVLKNVQTRRGTLRPHFDDPQPGDAALFREWSLASHGAGVLNRLKALLRLLRAAARRGRNH